jgi:hypothetical protein
MYFRTEQSRAEAEEQKIRAEQRLQSNKVRALRGVKVYYAFLGS